MAEAIQIAGKSEIYIALPGATSTLLKLGEQMDDTPVEFQHFKHDVHADSHGGPQGPPVEQQILGAIARVQFRLSKWDAKNREYLHTHNLFATEGEILQTEIGSLTLLERAFRVIVAPTRDNTGTLGYDPYFFNFPVAVVSGAIVCGQGTKHSILQFAMEAHRAPVGHAKAGVIFDRDTTDYDLLP